MVKPIVLPQSDGWITRIRDKSLSNMKEYGNCTQSILAPFMDELGIEAPPVMRAAGAMQGGMLSSLTCGVHVAGIMVLGLLMGREELEQGMDGLLPVVLPGQELISRLNERLGSHSCLELTGIDFTDLNQAIMFHDSGEYEKCLNRVAEGAEEIGLFLKQLQEKGGLYRI